jgi:hypothetical protein
MLDSIRHALAGGGWVSRLGTIPFFIYLFSALRCRIYAYFSVTDFALSLLWFISTHETDGRPS